MKLVVLRYEGGGHPRQEVYVEENFRTPRGLIFEAKLVRTPWSRHEMNFVVHAAAHKPTRGYLTRYSKFLSSPPLPNTQEGFEKAYRLFRKTVLEAHKLKNLAHPKKWPMFKNQNTPYTH